MPMNKFLFDHQLAAMKADRSGSPEERKEAAQAMGHRAKRIADWRKRNGLSDVGWPTDERPISERMNDRDIVTDEETPLQPGTGDWESEGGALEQTLVAVPFRTWCAYIAATPGPSAVIAERRKGRAI